MARLLLYTRPKLLVSALLLDAAFAILSRKPLFISSSTVLLRLPSGAGFLKLQKFLWLVLSPLLRYGMLSPTTVTNWLAKGHPLFLSPLLLSYGNVEMITSTGILESLR